MYLIVGLGNPGKKYEHTRHNAGFDLIDYVAKEAGISITENKFQAKIGKGMIAGQKVVLAKPQTYMNLSGDSVIQIVNYFDIDPTSELLIISDDIALAPGFLRIRKKGSAGGHNGLKSIIAQVKTQEFARMRVGVGGVPENGDQINHVLGRISKEDSEKLNKAFEAGRLAIEEIVAGNIDDAMSRYNGDASKEQ